MIAAQIHASPILPSISTTNHAHSAKNHIMNQETLIDHLFISPSSHNSKDTFRVKRWLKKWCINLTMKGHLERSQMYSMGATIKTFCKSELLLLEKSFTTVTSQILMTLHFHYAPTATYSSNGITKGPLLLQSSSRTTTFHHRSELIMKISFVLGSFWDQNNQRILGHFWLYLMMKQLSLHMGFEHLKQRKRQCSTCMPTLFSN